jgi:hypothetical protein
LLSSLTRITWNPIRSKNLLSIRVNIYYVPGEIVIPKFNENAISYIKKNGKIDTKISLGVKLKACLEIWLRLNS